MRGFRHSIFEVDKQFICCGIGCDDHFQKRRFRHLSVYKIQRITYTAFKYPCAKPRHIGQHGVIPVGQQDGLLLKIAGNTRQIRLVDAVQVGIRARYRAVYLAIRG